MAPSSPVSHDSIPCKSEKLPLLGILGPMVILSFNLLGYNKELVPILCGNKEGRRALCDLQRCRCGPRRSRRPTLVVSIWLLRMRLHVRRNSAKQAFTLEGTRTKDMWENFPQTSSFSARAPAARTSQLGLQMRRARGAASSDMALNFERHAGESSVSGPPVRWQLSAALR